MIRIDEQVLCVSCRTETVVETCDACDGAGAFADDCTACANHGCMRWCMYCGAMWPAMPEQRKERP